MGFWTEIFGYRTKEERLTARAARQLQVKQAIHGLNNRAKELQEDLYICHRHKQENYINQTKFEYDMGKIQQRKERFEKLKNPKSIYLRKNKS